MIIIITASLRLIGGVARADNTGTAPAMGFARPAAIPQTAEELWAGFAEGEDIHRDFWLANKTPSVKNFL